MRDHVLQHPLHPFQIGDFCAHVIEVSRSDGARLGTGLVALVDETTQELADFIERKAELARPQDEAQAPLMRGVVAAISARRARRLAQKADLLVIADGLQVAARPPRELSPLVGPSPRRDCASLKSFLTL